MTTHGEQTNTTSTSTGDAGPASEPEPSSTETEASTARTEYSAATGTDTSPSQGESQMMETEPSAARTEPSENGPSTAETEPPPDEPLFADVTLSGLRSRWDDVQAAFVDDPKECVQKADALVAQVVEQLTTGFSEARSRLEAQWDRGEQASTEDLRLALKRYREFFQRLLSV